MSYLPDTNIWIQMLKRPSLALVRQMTAVRDAEIYGCSVVRGELLHGAHKYARPDERRHRIINLLAPYDSLPFDDECASAFAGVRHDLETRGCVIGPFDLQIAAIALVHSLTVVTGNVDEFRRVHGLKVVDWSVPQE